MKKVADKLASFVAKNGRQFEHITRQKNPGDTPFKYVYLALAFLVQFHECIDFFGSFLFSVFCVFDILLCPDSFSMRVVLITNTMHTALPKRKKLF